MAAVCTVVVAGCSLGGSSDGAGAPARPAPTRGAGAAGHAATPARRPPYRYAFGNGSAAHAAKANGWNLIDVGSRWDADRLPAGTRALVWVGDYDNARCAWDVSDAALRRRVRSTAGDPKVAGYFFSDEPDPFQCPAAPAQHRARSRLIHALDGRAFTVMVSDSNSGAASLRQLPLWRGAADYVGLNPYVCRRARRCDLGWIDQIIGAADRAHLRYWGAVQAFGDEEWRWPTPRELQGMLDRWQGSRWSGFMTFAWRWAGDRLPAHPELLAVLRRFNAAAAGAARPATGATSGTRAPADAAPARGTAQQVHYTFTGPDAVAFDWAGTATAIRFGRTARYGKTVRARTPRPVPVSSRGPFHEATLTGLRPGTRYHYAIGGGPDATFTTAPSAPFRFVMEADVGATAYARRVAGTQAQIAADNPAFVLVVGDLTYANEQGKSAVDDHFGDVMAWSRSAAYMPAWGNHEWDGPGDDLRNYKGRFALPNAQASPGAPRAGCCGEDWGWFDAGGVRFISYPEPYAEVTWRDWARKADGVMAAAQADPRIRFVVTYGHRPAYSTGYHDGEPQLASILNTFGDRYGKYVLNLNGHSHDIERFAPIHHVVHITAGGGGAGLELPWKGKDQRTAYRAMHLGYLRIDVTTSALKVDAVCGPASSDDDVRCHAGDVIDSVTFPARG